jgi:Fe-S-cluster containining protein
VITDLVQISRLGDKKRAENAKFRAHLKTHVFVERRLKKIAQEIEEAIDCRACANCCRVATTTVTGRDIESMARYLGLPAAKFIAEYTVESKDEGRVLKRDKQTGCIFLDGNDCSIYEARPKTCADFPHLIRGAGSLESRMWPMADRATYCPIVYNTLESWKEEARFRR